MLYVFLVNTGTTLTFDMQLAMQTVDVLKKKIAECCRIPPDKQVLLISGGEWLDVTARVGSYSAGTDTSPIFLFSKLAEPPQMPSDPMQSSDEIEDQVAGSMALPPSYSTVVSRSQLAQQIFECGREQVRQCDQLIHEQHLQQQGWAAVVANMDDLSQVLEASGTRFSQQYGQYLQERPQHFTLLDAFPEDLQLLARIPMLEELDAAAGAARVPPGSSILDWISAQDTRRLEEVCDKAQQGLELLDEPFLQEVTAELRKILDPAMASEMSEIRGLEDRLMRLDELRHRAQIIVSEQKELAKAFIQNQARASCVNDPSVLPDLCASHCTQLQVMLDKHKQLVDARKRCAKAKEELSSNIHKRLGWVVSIQRRMSELSNKLMIHAERLKQLRQQVAVLAALHQAPVIYLTAVAEVVRRRQFTSQFLDWASNIASSAAAVHTAETVSRRRFGDTLKAHFIKGMFPGVDEEPPPFAAVCPADYDARLPPLTEQHLRRLREAVPELADHLSAAVERLPLPAAGPPPPPASPLPAVRAALRRLAEQLTADVTAFGDDLAAAGDRLAVAVRSVAEGEAARAADLERQVERYREQLSAQQAQLETEREQARWAQEQAIRATTLEQAVELERAEERCALLERELGEQLLVAGRLRSEMDAGSDRERIVGILEASFQERERKAVEACADRLRTEQEAERRAMREAHEAQLQRQAEEQRTKLILEWREVSEKQKREIEERFQRQLAELSSEQARLAEQRAAQATAEREAAVQAVTERLRAEHRAEVQALRSRFRMMTSNLGSPSDGSSENLPLGSPQSDAAGRRRAAAAAAAVAGPVADLLEQVRAARRHLQAAEPQRAADRLAETEARLLQLEAEPAPEADGAAAADQASVRRLQRDNERLRMQLSRSTSGMLERGQVSVLSCNDGDVVLVVWDAERRHYRVYQEAALLYFVHSDCYEALGLNAQDARRQYVTAEVVGHEFCQAKKEGNRYRVPRGTRFYRVRVRPWTRPAAAAAAEMTASVRRLSICSSVESHEAAA